MTSQPPTAMAGAASCPSPVFDRERARPLDTPGEARLAVGRSRTHDLGGRTVDARAAFPGDIEGEGLKGIRQYIRDHREGDFVRGFISKLSAYA